MPLFFYLFSIVSLFNNSLTGSAASCTVNVILASVSFSTVSFFFLLFYIKNKKQNKFPFCFYIYIIAFNQPCRPDVSPPISTTYQARGSSNEAR